MGLRYFDVVILVVSGACTEMDLSLAEDLDSFKVPHFVVRSQVDSDIENEAEDYKKEEERKTPNYNQLLEKAGDKVTELNMQNRVVVIDRDADRRYQFAYVKDAYAELKGEPPMPRSSPFQETIGLQNDDTESHEMLVKALGELKKAGKVPDEASIPPVGEELSVEFPMALADQLGGAAATLKHWYSVAKENMTEAEFKAFEKEMPKAWMTFASDLVKEYVEARDENEQDVERLKEFFRSASKDRYQTKADVLKAVWEELPKHTDKPVPPIDEELLAELAELPAVNEDEFMHPWGTADKLYKSEAIDAFGTKYLLGVFETVDEARKAFNEWNAEYEANRVTMREEMAQWAKQENARLDADTSGKDRIQKILDEARR